MVEASVVDHFLAAMAAEGGTGADAPPPIDPASSRSQPIKGPLIAVILLVLAALVLAAAIVQQVLVQNTQNSSYMLQSQIQNLKIDMLDAETGQRGFIITGDAAFLEPFNIGQASVAVGLQSLSQVLQTQPENKARLDAVKQLWGSKLAEMQQTIADRRAGQSSAAIARIAGGHGKALMDDIRRNMQRIIASAALQRETAVREFVSQEYLMMALGFLVLGLALMVAGREVYRARNASQALHVQQQQLSVANAHLESRVDQRSQQLSNITALLEAVINTTGEAIYAKDTQCRMVFANDACLRVIGKDRAQVIGRTDAQSHQNLAEAADIERNDRRIMASGIGETIEEIYSNGANYRVFLSSKAPIRGINGNIIGIVGVSSDITERKRTEAALFLSQQRFHAAISAFEGVVWTAAAAGGVLSANAQWSELTGLSEADALGQGWQSAQHPDDVAATRALWEVSLHEVRPFIGEYRLRNAQGNYRTMAVRAVPVLDAQGKVAEWVGLNIDITDARNVQMQHESALTRLTIAMEAANTGAFEIVPTNLPASTFDSRVLEIWGLPAGSHLTELLRAVHPDDQGEVARVFAGLPAMRVSDRVEMEYRILRPEGTQRWVAIRAKVFEAAGEPLRLIGTVRDVSQRRDQLDRIEFLMRELAHRSKNSLAVVQAIARQTAASANTMAEFQSSFAARVHGMAQSLDLLVKHDWTAVSIEELIHSQMAHLMDDHNGRIATQGPQIYLKPEAAQNIGLALHELATNAAKYGALTTTGGKIDIAWSMARAVDGNDVFKLHWRESGGPLVTPPSTKGFGHTVIHRVVRAALAGDSVLHFHETGVHWDVVIPATFVTIHPSA